MIKPLVIKMYLVLILLLVACDSGYSFPIEFTIINSSNVWGETEPCGWPKNPLGGLARKASIVERLELSNNTILVDSGDLLFSKNKLIVGQDNIDEAKIRANIIVDCFNKIGCNAFSPGQKDFALGLDYLNKIKNKANFDFISCNLFFENSRERIFDEYKIEEINGYKIAYISALSVFENKSLFISEPILAIQNTLNKIIDEVDFVILLFNGTNSDISRLQKNNLEGIDLILRSQGSSRASDNGGNNRIPIFTSGNKGKYLNQITYTINDNNNPFVDINFEENNIKISKKHLKNKKKGDPDANLQELYKDNEKILSDIASYRNKIKISQSKIDNAVNTIKSMKIPLNAKVESKPEILLIVDNGMNMIPKGPPIKDVKGRLPEDPHHGHDHWFGYS